MPHQTTVCEVGYWLKQNQRYRDLIELWRREDPMVDNDLLTEGNRRLDILLNKQTPDWTTKVGATVRGFRSVIDGSIQPYGVVVPARAAYSHSASVGSRAPRQAQ